MIDRRPAVVVRPSDASDVAQAVDFAREQDVVLAVRGGGHNIAGNAVSDGGVMIDLTSMKSILVDTANRTVKVGPGVTLGEARRRDPGAWSRHPAGDQLHHRRRGTHARRRLRLDQSQARADRRQPGRGRRGHGGRTRFARE